MQDQQLEGGGLRARFFWQGDRYAHAIAIAQDGRWLEVLHSIEGSEQDHWPPSPALQSLARETRPAGRQVALLVGMAGKSHWSLSVDLDPEAGCLTFDVACRISAGAPGPLGSQYHAADLPAGHVAVLSETGPARLELRVDAIAIVPTAEPATAPWTARWSYRISTARQA